MTPEGPINRRNVIKGIGAGTVLTVVPSSAVAKGPPGGDPPGRADALIEVDPDVLVLEESETGEVAVEIQGSPFGRTDVKVDGVDADPEEFRLEGRDDSQTVTLGPVTEETTATFKAELPRGETDSEEVEIKFESTIISDWYDLDEMREDLHEDYVLVNDLDRETAGYDELVGDPEEGWEPIGAYPDNPNNKHLTGFRGSFDGAGHSISGLSMDRSESHIGLFSLIYDGEVTDLHIENADVTGSEIFVGILAGANEGLIKGVTISGQVAGAAGVAGIAAGHQYSEAVIEDCIADVEASGDGSVGAIVGSMINNDPTVQRCVAVGEISSTGASTGGLVGSLFNGTIADSYSVAAVSGDGVGGFAGAIAGNNEFGTTPSATTCYAAGVINGQSDEGGFSPSSGADVTDTYWDEDATTATTSPDGSTGLSTAQFTGSGASQALDGFDFEDDWETVSADDDDATDDGYPILQALDRERQLEAQGVLDD